jgi:uncharacterized phage protein gp47/JayE
MSDVLDADGLQTKTLAELITELEDDYKDIYGEDINVDQNSPDGQVLNILAQEGIDLRELLTLINAGFDPDQAYGRILDQRVALNGISRNGGTFTYQYVSITVDRALSLVGLDDDATEIDPAIENLYTVRDDAGTEFYLLESYDFVGAGTQSLLFRAADIGEVQTELNTITTAVTVVAGVTTINNPLAATSTGEDEETDAQLKVRRRGSVAVSSTGYLDGIEAALNDLAGVTTALVYENDTDSVDGDGTDPHTIWCIVEGGDPDDIGEVIYAKKSSGSGMRGDEEVDITRPNGSTFTAKYDIPGTEDLYIQFAIELIGGGYIDEDALKLSIVNGITWGIGSDAGSDDVTSFLKSLNSNYRVTEMEVSTNGSDWYEEVSVASPENRFVSAVARITIL